jgi:hypothetical protein
MAAPQQVAGGPAFGGVTLFYAPPAGQDINMGAAFLANMVQQRTIDARMMLQKRLASLDRSGQQAALVELAKARNDVLQQMAANERSRTDAKVQHTIAMKDVVTARIDKDIAEIKASSDQNVAAMNVEEERRKARAISPKGQDIVESAQGAVDAAVYQLQEIAKLPPEQQAVENEKVYDGLISSLANDSRVAAQLGNQDEQDAVADRIRELNTSFPLKDPSVTSELQDILGNTFSRAAAIPEARRGYQKTKFEDLMGEAVDTYSAIEDRFPAEQTGSQSSGTSTRGPRPAAASSGEGDSASPRSGGGAGGGAGPSDEKLEEQLRAIDHLMKKVDSYDPSAALGGIYDPYPGAGAPRKSSSSTGSRSPRGPQDRKAMDRVADLFGGKKGEPQESPRAGSVGQDRGRVNQPAELPVPEGKGRPASPPKGSGAKVKSKVDELFEWQGPENPHEEAPWQGPHKPSQPLPADGTRASNEPDHQGVSEKLESQLRELGADLDGGEDDKDIPWNERRKRRAAGK